MEEIKIFIEWLNDSKLSKKDKNKIVDILNILLKEKEQIKQQRDEATKYINQTLKMYDKCPDELFKKDEDKRQNTSYANGFHLGVRESLDKLKSILERKEE